MQSDRHVVLELALITLNWTDVVESIATAAAAAVTAITLIFLLLQLRIQKEQSALQARSAEATRQQARRSQASMVSVHMSRKEEASDGVWFEFEVDNKSGTPCYHVFFEVFDGSLLHYARLGEVRSSRVDRVRLGIGYRSVAETDPARHTWPYFRVTFMDNANVFWMRDSLGRLLETSEGFPPERESQLSLAEYRAYHVNAELLDYPLRTSGLLPPEEMWRKGGTTAWQDLRLCHQG